jgi:hypothetical protein
MGPSTLGHPASDPGELSCPASDSDQEAAEEANSIDLADVAAVPWYLATLSKARRECDRLTARMAAVRDRIEGKQKVAAALTTGQMTLLEAARQFHALDKADPARNRQRPPVLLMDGVEEERYCRSVIHYVRGFLLGWPEATVKTVIGRLEAELQTYLNSGTSRPARHPTAD